MKKNTLKIKTQVFVGETNLDHVYSLNTAAENRRQSQSEPNIPLLIPLLRK